MTQACHMSCDFSSSCLSPLGSGFYEEGIDGFSSIVNSTERRELAPWLPVKFLYVLIIIPKRGCFAKNHCYPQREGRMVILGWNKAAASFWGLNSSLMYKLNLVRQYKRNVFALWVIDFFYVCVHTDTHRPRCTHMHTHIDNWLLRDQLLSVLS